MHISVQHYVPTQPEPSQKFMTELIMENTRSKVLGYLGTSSSNGLHNYIYG